MNIENDLILLFENWSGESYEKIEKMPAHGSDRQYYRISGANKKAYGAYNPDRSENIAFITFSKHFASLGLPVPEIYAVDHDKYIYLEQDLGDETLFSFLSNERSKNGFSDIIVDYYLKVIKELPRFQITASKGLDYSVCYPRHSFDKQSMMWDLNYFKYYFLKLANISFDEQKLEDDFQKFSDYLLKAENDFFLYRDFQSRNIMLNDERPYFIDYQGGRKGALQYDIASLLYDAKADIPNNIRDFLLEEYIKEVSNYLKFDKKEFTNFYHGFVLIRIMQAFGAYGFRGFYQRKTHFLKSIPYALLNLESIVKVLDLPIEIPTLYSVWEKLLHSTFLKQFSQVEYKLNVRVKSFSYRKGLPQDDNGHGGGYVFDLRCLPNPGRYPEYKSLTGADSEVIIYLEKENKVKEYFSHVCNLIDMSISNYQERKFTDLSISFGCTGGQHRSVYFANKLSEYLNKKYDLNVILHHREMDKTIK